MKKYSFVPVTALLLCALLAACSVEIAQTSVPATARPATATAAATNTQIPASSTSTALPETTPIDNGSEQGAPAETALPGLIQLPFDFPALESDFPEAEILDGWQELGLSGRLTFLSNANAKQSLLVFDFETGDLSPIFFAPENTWLTAASVNPDRGDILIAYAPPPEAGKPQYGYTDLYRLTAGGSQLQPLLERSEDQEAFFGSFYSPLGDSIYFTWFLADDSVSYGFRYHVSRLDLATGEASIVVEDAFWQAVSPDNQKLAYVTFDPDAGAGDPDLLMIAGIDGTGSQAVLDPEEFPTVDAPFFSPDAEYLYFSAVSETPSLSWLEKVMGVRVALAHNVPSDWWRVRLASGEAQRITEIFDQGLNGAFSPHGEHIAFISASGLWAMNPEGSGLVQVIESRNFYGNLTWIE